MLSESRKKANEKYFDKFDDIKIRVPKGKKEEYKSFAKKHNVSLNGLVCELLERAMHDKNFDVVLDEPIEEGMLKGFSVANMKIR